VLGARTAERSGAHQGPGLQSSGLAEGREGTVRSNAASRPFSEQVLGWDLPPPGHPQSWHSGSALAGFGYISV